MIYLQSSEYGEQNFSGATVFLLVFHSKTLLVMFYYGIIFKIIVTHVLKSQAL